MNPVEIAQAGNQFTRGRQASRRENRSARRSWQDGKSGQRETAGGKVNKTCANEKELTSADSQRYVNTILLATGRNHAKNLNLTEAGQVRQMTRFGIFKVWTREKAKRS